MIATVIPVSLVDVMIAIALRPVAAAGGSEAFSRVQPGTLGGGLAFAAVSFSATGLPSRMRFTRAQGQSRARKVARRIEPGRGRIGGLTTDRTTTTPVTTRGPAVLVLVTRLEPSLEPVTEPTAQ